MTRYRPAVGGFSIIELLIALIIIGILTSIAVTNVAKRAEEARLKSTLQEMTSIRDALERVSIDTRWVMRLHVLDDVGGGDDIVKLSINDDNDLIDGILDENDQVLVGNPEQIFIHPATGELLTPADAQLQFDRLENNETTFGWTGPYITYRRFDEQVGLYPADAWGTPYLFFTSEGYMVEPDGRLEAGTNTSGQFNSLGSVTFDCDRFDRFTIISCGPDGLPGDNGNSEPGTGDDLKVQF